MGDPGYTELVNIDKTKTLKCEGLEEVCGPSASVPIPVTQRGGRLLYDNFSTLNPDTYHWSDKQLDLHADFNEPTEDSLIPKMDDDDIFQVEKTDLIQGPTLAELNANEETLLGDLNFDDLLLPEERGQSSHFETVIDFPPNCSFTGTNANTLQFTSSSVPLSVSSNRNLFIDDSVGSKISLPIHKSVYRSTLDEVMSNANALPYGSPNEGQSKVILGSPIELKVSRLSMSAPTQSIYFENAWTRREPRKYLLSTGSLGEAGSTSSVSTSGALSPKQSNNLDFVSHDEGYEESEEDSEHYEDCSSENDTGGSENEDQTSNVVKVTNDNLPKDNKLKKEKYFWQYNVQAKGPKGQRLISKARFDNPYILNEATDPVFSPNCVLRGIKHSGKARKGDGNDLTPNPRKLHNIGKELDNLNRIINDMTLATSLPSTVKPKTRKEKNKLASRACRLKKKAQHEANKIKLYGLEQEHRRLIHGIVLSKEVLKAKFNESNPENQEELTQKIEKIHKNSTKWKIANHTTDYVNSVLEKVRSGSLHGGIEDS